jgi:RHS repeat-associated protein
MPYKFNGKEFDEETGLYYYGARYMNPVASIWYGVDPLTEKYTNVSAYTYCLSNPVKMVDPDGRDAKVTINKDKKTITIEANIILVGLNATQQLADKYKDDIMKTWGSIKSYKYEGDTYNINWKIDVRVKTKDESKVYDGINNYITPYDGISFVDETGNNGKWRRIFEDGKDPAPHEFGHLLGLKDRYVTTSQKKRYGKQYYGRKYLGWEGNIMAESAGKGKVTNKNMDCLLKPLFQKCGWFSSTNVFQINKDFNREKPNGGLIIVDRNRKRIK